eukprot:TRINITY_DN5445_c0_g1_i1.p1 TRINITY_DN5445_c0_g1~~TRINITY_DN5445_c0_g1_i1.p1  ORF type:complete len:412 (+),score=84.49 TRINITY_DN5445_c0_g1_i1:91-1236(+)
MPPTTFREIHPSSRPKAGEAPRPDMFTIVERSVDLDALAPGTIAVKTLYLSVDPYLRSPLGFDGDEARPSPPAMQMSQFKDAASITAFDEVFGGRGAGIIIKSNNKDYKEGDLVAADWKWTEIAVFDPSKEITFEKLDPSIFTTDATNDKDHRSPDGKFNLSHALGLLSVSGSHAYYGVIQALQVKRGDLVVVSGAGGSIGLMVDQLVQVFGGVAVGVAGGEDKCAKLVSSKLVNHAIDYKAAGNSSDKIIADLKAVAPQGVDKYFDNTGGPITEAVVASLNKGGRIYVCGAVSDYNNVGWMQRLYQGSLGQGPDVTVQRGADLSPTYLPKIPEARVELIKFVREGTLTPHEYVVEGFDHVPRAWTDMLAGKNFGKTVVKL